METVPQPDAQEAAKVEAASRRLPPEQEAQWHPGQTPFFNPEAGYSVTHANLPHWRQDGTTYFVTFRLVDSLPRDRLDQWILDREAWQTAHPEPWSEAEDAEYHARFSAVIEDWLDQGSGSCVLALPDCKSMVTDALRHFAGQRYQLGEFVVASNHVHVILTPLSGHRLSGILHSWKSFSAKQIIKLEPAARRLEAWWHTLHQRRLVRAREEYPSRYDGVIFQRPVWQKESFDHLVRSAASLHKFAEYIRNHREWGN